LASPSYLAIQVWEPCAHPAFPWGGRSMRIEGIPVE
jgi:hypothetical protein